MRLVRVTETVPHGGTIRLHHLTDLHAGAPDFDEDAFVERRSLIENDPDARWTMGGDGGDLIRHNDRRYQPTELHSRYRTANDVRYATREHLRDLFYPIRDKCWGWADGNHERALDNHYGGKFGVEVCCDLGIEARYVGYRGFVHVAANVGKRGAGLGILIDLQHGWQTGRSKGGPMVQAERELGMTDADVVLRGHNHAPASHVFATLGVNNGVTQIVPRHRSVINGGCWRRGYRADLEPIDRNRLSEVEGDLWGESKGFRAEPIGGAVLSLRFDQGRAGDGRGRSASIEHTIISGVVTGQSLGLAA